MIKNVVEVVDIIEEYIEICLLNYFKLKQTAVKSGFFLESIYIKIW